MCIFFLKDTAIFPNLTHNKQTGKAYLIAKTQLLSPFLPKTTQFVRTTYDIQTKKVNIRP